MWLYWPAKPSGSIIRKNLPWARISSPGVITVLPKVGPLKVLDIKGPTAETERLYITSVNHCTTAMVLALRQLATARPQILMANRDLDTGARLVPGGYPLTDETYAKLLDRITRNPARPLPAGLKVAILEYYADPNAPIATRRNPKKWARVQRGSAEAILNVSVGESAIGSMSLTTMLRREHRSLHRRESPSHHAQAQRCTRSREVTVQLPYLVSRIRSMLGGCRSEVLQAQNYPECAAVRLTGSCRAAIPMITYIAPDGGRRSN